MQRRASLCLLALLLVSWTSARAWGSDWQTVYHDNFEKTYLVEALKATGDWSVSKGHLSIVSEKGGMLRLDQVLDASAVRVSVECWFTGETISDIGVIIGLGAHGQSGAAKFTLGADNNRGVRLAVPARPAVFVDTFKLEPNKHYQLVAESNGTMMTLWIDGQVIAQRKTLLPLEPGQIALTVGQGTVYFSNLTVQTKATADTAQTIQVQDQLRQTQHEAGYIPELWSLSSLKTKKKSSRVRKRLVPIVAQSVLATDQTYPVTFGVPLPRRQILIPPRFACWILKAKRFPLRSRPRQLGENRIH